MEFTPLQNALLIILALLLIWKSSSTLRYRLTVHRYGCSPVPWYPHKDPILGYDLYRRIKAAKERNTLDSLITEILSLYGNSKTLMSLTLGLPTLISVDPRLVQAMLTTNIDDFGVEPIRKVANQPLFAQDVFVSDGLPWKTSRKFARRVLQKNRFAKFGCLERHVDHLLRQLPADNKTQVDLQSYFRLMYVDIATEMISGEPMNSLLPGATENIDEFLTSIERANKGIQRRVILAPILKFAARDHELEAACKAIHQYFDKCIDGELSRKREKAAETEEIPPLVRDALYVSQDRIFVRDQLIGFFLPMYSSSVFTLSDLFFQLARAPDVWKALRKEVLVRKDAPLTYELLKSMTYLQAVIRESIRLLAPADRIIRMCVRSCVLPCGGGPSGDNPIFVQKGTLVDFRSNVLHRDSKFWGEDARLFRPERWLEGSLRPKWEYVPFGGGARICPAQQMILTQYAYILFRFVDEFSVLENRDPCFEFVAEFNLSKRSRHGVQVALTRSS